MIASGICIIVALSIVPSQLRTDSFRKFFGKSTGAWGQERVSMSFGIQAQLLVVH